jgi:hypothetical protein
MLLAEDGCSEVVKSAALRDGKEIIKTIRVRE